MTNFAPAMGRAQATGFMSGTAGRPIHVAHVAAAPGWPGRRPVVMIHGGCHSGACYIDTPDGRPGWARIFAAAGHDVFVADWPGRGGSPACDDLAVLPTGEIAESLRVLAERVGPAVLVTHSAGGPMGWWVAEQSPDAVCAVIGVAAGAPANILKVLPDDAAEVAKYRDDISLGCPVLMPEDRPVVVDERFIRAYWANAPRFPASGFAQYCTGIFPESARLFNERFNIGGSGLRIADPQALRRLPVLMVTGDHDPRHPREMDAATAAYLGAEFVWLADRGITGNGHMLMIEDNSDEIAALLLEWLHARGL